MSAVLFDAVHRIAQHAVDAHPVAAVGVVVDTFDGRGVPPDHAVTVQLREAGLVLPRVPVAVGALGFAAIPEPGELVIVVFADGDPHAAVVVGRLYHADRAPPDHSAGDLVLRLPSGASSPALSIVVRGGDPSVRVTLGKDVAVEISDTRVVATAGEASAVVESRGGGRAEISVGQASFTVKGSGDIEVSTTGAFRVKATEIALQGNATLTLSAPQVKVN